MKTAVVYYSLEGNTHFAAEIIGRQLGADLVRLSPEKAYPTRGFGKYFWAGKSASFRESPRLSPYRFDVAQYDLIILGTPVWAGIFAPPLRTFLRANPLAGKRIALFACCSGGDTAKCFEALMREAGGGAPASTLRMVDPLKGVEADVERSIGDFCAKLQSPQPRTVA